MREILFRGKTEYGIWKYGDLEHNGKNNPKWVDGEEIIPETVGQYAGLTDKNGKKIFEGDIVKIHRKYLNAGCEEDCFYRVDWHKYWNGWAIRNIKSTQSCYLEDAKKGEVIGNIHDNPELLEVKYER